jgi:hypothetical protein
VKIAEIIEALFPETNSGKRGVTADGVDAIPYHAVRAEMGLAHEGGYVTPLDLAKVLELRPPKPPKPPKLPTPKASSPVIVGEAPSILDNADA